MTSYLTTYSYTLLDRGLIPDPLLRLAIRKLCRQRLDEIKSTSLTEGLEKKWKYIAELGEVEEVGKGVNEANEQHYEVSTEFIQSCLGPRLKYSCCLYPTGKETLAEAEELMLESYAVKAKLEDGMNVLDLGCGWGSLGLWLAEKYPNSTITALSNSSTQKIFIDSQAEKRGLKNLQVITGDVTKFDFEFGENGQVLEKFDRIMSIEMFEHMKNYSKLLTKISTWLKPKGLLFVHIFCHKDTPYHFEDNDGWMSQNFFSGGTMPSLDLFSLILSPLSLTHSWYIPGTHYQKTCEDWLKLQDSHKINYGTTEYNRFRVFFLSCAEFFGMDGGEQWGVGHYLFEFRN